MRNLPVIEPVIERSCGECTACCTAYPILASEDFFPEAKPAATPCKHLCATGCSIYDQRPPICKDFQCDYLDGTLGKDAEEWRPDRCGVILLSQQRLGKLFQGDVPEGLDPNSTGQSIAEVWPRSLIALDYEKLRYRLKKATNCDRAFTVIYPYGFDMFNSHSELSSAMYRVRRLGVWWMTEEEKRYSREVATWWNH